MKTLLYTISVSLFIGALIVALSATDMFAGESCMTTHKTKVAGIDGKTDINNSVGRKDINNSVGKSVVGSTGTIVSTDVALCNYGFESGCVVNKNLQDVGHGKSDLDSTGAIAATDMLPSTDTCDDITTPVGFDNCGSATSLSKEPCIQPIGKEPCIQTVALANCSSKKHLGFDNCGSIKA